MKLWDPDEFVSDGYGTLRIGEWGGWYVEIQKMIYNDRIVLSPTRLPLVYDYGWCLHPGFAVVAARAWNPQPEAEPPGFIKRIGARRWPGETAKGFHP